MKSAIRRPVAALMAASMFAFSLPAPAAPDAAPAELARQRVELLLVENGVAAQEARARVAALTDEEATRVAAEFDKLPAGGMDPVTIGMILFIFVAGAVLIVALPFILLAKAIEANRRSGAEDPVREDANQSGNGRYPEPRY